MKPKGEEKHRKMSHAEAKEAMLAAKRGLGGALGTGFGPTGLLLGPLLLGPHVAHHGPARVGPSGAFVTPVWAIIDSTP